MTDEEELYAIVRIVVDRAVAVVDVSPAWVATETMQEIGFARATHRLAYAGCHLEVRQIARQLLRGRFDPAERAKESADETDDLFPETLQDRYPRRPKKDEEPVYALRDQLLADDVDYNVERMMRAGQALLKHARALKAWDAARRHSA